MMELRRNDRREKLVVDSNCGNPNKMLNSSAKSCTAVNIEMLEYMAEVAAGVSSMLCDKLTILMLAKSEGCNIPGWRILGRKYNWRTTRF